LKFQIPIKNVKAATETREKLECKTVLENKPTLLKIFTCDEKSVPKTIPQNPSQHGTQSSETKWSKHDSIPGKTRYGTKAQGRPFLPEWSTYQDYSFTSQKQETIAKSEKQIAHEQWLNACSLSSGGDDTTVIKAVQQTPKLLLINLHQHLATLSKDRFEEDLESYIDDFTTNYRRPAGLPFPYEFYGGCAPNADKSKHDSPQDQDKEKERNKSRIPVASKPKKKATDSKEEIIPECDNFIRQQNLNPGSFNDASSNLLLI